MISKVFPLERNLFDLVIVDEASQLAVERALPFLYRANHVIIAGDEKQKGFVESVKEFDVKLISQIVEDNYAELTFDYKMIGESSNVTNFVGKHIQTWKNGKIIKEEYISVS